MATSESQRGRVVGAIDRFGAWGLSLLGRGGDESGPKAELVDGAEVLFIDRRAPAKAPAEHTLALLYADEYPAPAVLRCRAPMTIPDEAGLAPAGPSDTLLVDGKRVIVRQYSLVEPERTGEFSRHDRLEAVPVEIAGETIPETPPKTEFLDLVCSRVSEKMKHAD